MHFQRTAHVLLSPKPTQRQPLTVSQVCRRQEVCEAKFSTAVFGHNTLKWAWHCDFTSFSSPKQYTKDDIKDIY